jgi:hypothetical protein
MCRPRPRRTRKKQSRRGREASLAGVGLSLRSPAMIRSRSEPHAERRDRTRGRRVRRGGFVALIALAVQILAPILHGPHGHVWLEDSQTVAAASSADHGSSVRTPDDHDCSQCPVCIAIAHAAQPVVPTASVQVVIAGPVSFEVVREWSGGPGVVRVVTESGPRGPPVV